MQNKNIFNKGKKSILNFFRTLSFRIALPLTLIIGGSIGFAFSGKDDDHLFEISKNMEVFGNLFQQLNKLYVDEPKPGELMKIGIEAMLASLDPYTNYIPAEELEDFKYQTSGEYGGIGAQVKQIGDYIVIAETYEGFVAQKSGLKAGDIFLEIDGKNCKNKSYAEMGKLLKGLPNTSVKIKVQREGELKPLDFIILRDEVKVKNVPYFTILDNHIGYIKLTGFMENTAAEVRAALISLKEKGATSIIIDERDNPGGLLREAVGIVNLFVNKGQLIVSMRGRVKDWEKEYKSEETPVDTEIPLVIIVNSLSASASEIVAGALQDLDRAVVIGQRSFGKGLVQQTLPIAYGALFKVTVAKYYIPSGRCVQSIDYSHRNADGTLDRFADSLITPFKTKNGRTVWDGLGVIPDIQTAEKKFSVITDSLIAKSLLFYYATKYTQLHPSIEKPETFRIADREYEEFVSWVKTKDFSYQLKEEKDLVNYKKHALNNKNFSNTESEFDLLLKKMQSGKTDDFAEFKTEISELLEAEIASRYYYQAGRAAATIKDDSTIQSATTLLKEPKKWKSILTTIVASSRPLQKEAPEH